MEKGVIFIEIKDGESGDNPYRTGRIVGLTLESVMGMGWEEGDPRVYYMTESRFKEMGLDELLKKEPNKNLTE
jgi:hypothetical protein